MKIAFNPSTVAALTTPPNNKDITFDLRGRNIFARGVKFCGTDTNTWRDIKINNVSIGSNILDLRNGSNTTLTNINGVVTINSTWRPVVDNLTSDSTTSSLSAKQGKVLKSLIDGKSNSGHTHDDRYLKLTGGIMASNALITFADSGSWGTDKEPQGARGGLYWTGQSDYAKLYAEETVGDNLDLVIQFGDDNSNGLSIRNKANTQTSYISAGGVITTGTFKGNLDWSYITNKPSSYTPSAHTHAWNSLTHSSTTENQAILTNGKANGWKLYTLNISRWDNAANNAHSHANKSVLDGITSALVNNWNVAYTFVNTITGTDTDKVINKWDEIVNFLAGITEDNKLNTLLNNKLSVYKLADNTNVGAIKNNGIYYSTSDASSGTLVNSPFNNGFTLINMTSLDNGDDLRRSRLAFNAYGEIKVSNDRDQANTAETWYNVLTSKNSGISGSTIKLNGTSITVYSSSTADGRYVKKSGDTMLGALNFANNTWNKVGDDVYMGDHNIGGQLCIMGVNGTTGLSFHKYGDASIRKSITFDGNTLYMNGSCDYAALSNQTNLLAINTVPNKTTATSIGSWSPISGRYVFHQKWTDTSTGGDSADFGIYLDGNLTANMVLDGYYNSLLGFRVIGATGGFLKANGTIDNSTYLTSHQSLSNYYTKSEVDTKLNSKLNYRLFWERTNIDLNSITEAWHTYEVSNGTGTANTPTNASWHQAVQWGTGDTNYAVQLCTAYTSNYSLYLRHKIAGKWNNWIQLATTTDIPSSLKNPHALTISLNGTSQGPYDGSAAKNINITPSSIGAATSNHTHPYLPLSGGTVTGNIILKGGTSADMTYAGNVHPYIRFDNSDSSQNVSLIFTDYDTYKRPAGIKLVGNQGNEWFEAANIYATTFYGALSGNASSANKLTTARNIALGTDLRGSANFDGSSNITISANINACTVQVSSTNGLPFKRIAHFETGSSWNDNALLLYISQGYINGSNGICRVEFRTDNISSSSTSVTASAAVRWLVRNGYGLDSLYAGYYVTTSKAYIDIYLKTTSSYQGTVIRVLQDSRGSINSNVQLINSYYYSDTNHKEAYNSIEAASTALYNRAYTRIVSGSDVGTVSYSNSTGSVHWNNVTNKPSTFAPAAHTHTVFKNNLMIKGTNGISDSASIHLGIGDSDTGFKWISDGKCQIYANNSAVGEWTSGGMNWFKNPTVNGNKIWNAGNDGSGSGLDADKIDGYHASSLWRSDGATWNPNANVSLNASANSQEWSFDIRRNGYTGCYWHVWDSALSTLLKVNADNGKVYAPYNFVGNLEGNASTASKLQTPRTIWGQRFDGTSNVDNTLRIRQTTGNWCEGIRIQTADSTWATIILGATGDSGTNANAWSIHRKSDNNFAISRNSSDGTNGLVMTSVGMGLGTTAPTQRLDVHGNIRATGQLYLPTNGNYNAILMGDDCWMGDCNIGDVIGLSGRNNANAGGIKFGKGGMYIGYNGSNHYSSGTSLWSNFNADLLDGYHADNIQSAGWRNLYRTGGSSNVIKWTRIGRCITNANDNAQNDGMIEFHTNGDQNYKYFGYGRLQISQYGQSSRSLMLQSFTSEGIHFYATIDEDNYIWLGHNAWWSGNSAYRVIWSGSYIEWYSSGMSMQTSNPNSVYVTDNGTFKKPNETGFVCLNNVYVEASKLKTARTIWGQRFDGTGNVNGTLQIERASNFGSYNEGIRIVGNSNEWCVIMLGCKAGSYSGVINSQWELMKTASDTFRIGRGSSSSSFLEIINNGNVGIGTTSPAYKLDVVGNIRATGNSYATHFYESSDKTLKKNIKSILSSTNIPKIREFDWKDTEEHSYGFIAQELEEQGYDCLVSEVNGKKTVNYTATLALTVAKLQNLINIQNKKISNLTKELKALKYGRKKNS